MKPLMSSVPLCPLIKADVLSGDDTTKQTAKDAEQVESESNTTSVTADTIRAEKNL